MIFGCWRYQGTNASGLAGTIFDVSHKFDVYGPGKSYNIFAGKDGSKGLGMSSLSPEYAIPDYSGLDESDMKVLNDWYDFFSYVYLLLRYGYSWAKSTGSKETLQYCRKSHRSPCSRCQPLKFKG